MDPQPPAAASTREPFQCAFCPQSFTSNRDLVDHKVKSQDHFFCRRCRLDLPTAADLQQHLEGPIQAIAFAQHGQVRCNPCRRDFASMTFLTTHLYTNHWNLCKECLLDFHSPWALNRHRATAHPRSNRPFSISRSTTFPHLPPSASNSSVSLTETEQHSFESRSTEQDSSTSQSQHVSQEAAQSTENASQEASESTQNVSQEASQPSEQVPQEAPQSVHDGSQNTPSPEPETDEAAVRDESQPLPESPARQRLPPFCATCRIRFPSEDALQQHLEHSSSVIPHCRLPNGAFRCFICLRVFPALVAFKKHLARLDRRHEETLNHYKWCTRCLLQFHTHKGLTKHMNEQHVPNTSPQHQQALSSPNEAAIPSTQPGPSVVTADASSRNLASSSISPVDRLFASISLSAPTLPSDHETWDSVASDSLLAPVLEETRDPVSSATNGSSSPSTPPSATMQPVAVENTEGVSALSSAIEGETESARPNPFFCRKCKLGFSSSQEQKEHVRNGMSAIKESENGDGGFACAQCSRSFSDIRAMKGHLRSHDLTCTACLMYFHVQWAFRAHKQSLHASTSNNGEISVGTSPQPLGSTTDSTPADRPPSHSASPATQPASRESRAGTRGHHRPQRSHRVVRQISIMDFSDTDDDDLLSDIDASHLGGWDISDIQRPRGSNADSYAGRTGSNPRGRNTRHSGRREPDDDQWWWDGPPPAASWDDLAAGRVSREHQSIKITPPSKSSVHPKVPRVSSVAIACSVCLEEAAVDLTSTPCGHVGCETCLRTAVKTKPECPICRKPTKLSDLRPLFL